MPGSAAHTSFLNAVAVVLTGRLWKDNTSSIPMTAMGSSCNRSDTACKQVSK